MFQIPNSTVQTLRACWSVPCCLEFGTWPFFRNSENVFFPNLENRSFFFQIWKKGHVPNSKQHCTGLPPSTHLQTITAAFESTHEARRRSTKQSIGKVQFCELPPGFPRNSASYPRDSCELPPGIPASYRPGFCELPPGFCE